MNRIIIVSVQNGLLDRTGAISQGCVIALSRLSAAGFDIVLLSDSEWGNSLFNREQILQLLSSQGAQVSRVLELPTPAVAGSGGSADLTQGHPGQQDSLITQAAGGLAPLFANQNYQLSQSAIYGDGSLLRGLAAYLSLPLYLPDWCEQDDKTGAAANAGSTDSIANSQEASINSQITESWLDLATQLSLPQRTAEVHRKSSETDIQVAINLDAEHPAISINTGLGFFDHMLEQIGKHGGFSLQLDCQGDLHIDEHHTVEDCALALGQALREALGDKRGIGRYGFQLPMDECEVSVSMDLSARPSFHFNGDFTREKVGDLSTEMVPHFFKSLSDALGASLHISMHGDNAHHQVEVIFKGVARTLRQALRREGNELPSTKGML